MSISVVVSSRIIERCKDNATKIVNGVAAKHSRDYGKSDRGDYYNHLQGLWGEMAFSLLTGLYTHTAVDVVDQFDFLLPDGRTLDVKHTVHRNGTLILVPESSKDREQLSDLYVLVVGKPPVFDVIGYTTGDILYQNHTYHPKIKSYRKWLPQDKLIPIRTLLDEIYSYS